VPVALDEEFLGLPQEISRPYVSRLVPHPLAAFTQPLRLTGDGGSHVPRSFVHCVDEYAAAGEGDAPRPADFVRPYAELALAHG